MLRDCARRFLVQPAPSLASMTGNTSAAGTPGAARSATVRSPSISALAAGTAIMAITLKRGTRFLNAKRRPPMTSEREKCAAREWKPISKLPNAARTYLISANFGGMQAHDVAFYHGWQPDGSRRWTLANVEISADAIDYYAEINPPSSKDKNDE